MASMLPISDSFQQPNTLAYYFFKLNKSPDTVVGVELYTDKNGLKEHGTAPSFSQFSKSAGSLFAKQFTLHQSKPACGFLTKDNDSTANIMSDRTSISVFVQIYCQSAEHRARYLEAASEYVKSVSKEAGTLSYYWTADLKDLTKIYVFERYVNQAAAKTHSAAAQTFVKDTKSLIKSATIELGTPVGGFLNKVDKVAQASKL